MADVAVPHPIRAAMLARDLDAAMALMSPVVVLYSPVTRYPFHGASAVRALLEQVIDNYETLEYRREVADGDLRLLWFEIGLGGRRIETLDVLRLDEQGRIAEIRVFARPIADTAIYAAQLGPGLARSQGRVRELVTRLAARPLPALLRGADSFGARLLGSRRSANRDQGR